MFGDSNKFSLSKRFEICNLCRTRSYNIMAVKNYCKSLDTLAAGNNANKIIKYFNIKNSAIMLFAAEFIFLYFCYSSPGWLALLLSIAFCKACKENLSISLESK